MIESLQKTTILIADRHPVFCYGLHQALAAEPDFQVVAEMYDGEAALAGLREYQPRLVVLDMGLPCLDGFRVVAAARAEHLRSKFVLLSMHNEAIWLKKALRLGVQGYILKDSVLAAMITGLRSVAQGNPYYSPALMVHSLRPRGSASQVLGLSADLSVAFAHLTPTERRILKLIGECRTTKEIASYLLISPRTVEKHRANICQKLDLRGNHALAKIALAQRDHI